MTAIDADLIQSYRQTLYRVHDGDTLIAFHVERNSVDLDDLLLRNSARCAALITAFNPYSRPQARYVNDHAHQTLCTAVESLGLIAIEGMGEDPSGHWPGELSLLILDISLAQARQLAAQFEQNAFVWCEFGTEPRLILMR